MAGQRGLYFLGRLGQMFFVLWVIATILFLIFRLMPGNPLTAYIDPNFTEEQQQALIKSFGLDQPLYVQYFVFLGKLVQGDLGRSFIYRAPVGEVLWDFLPNTLWLSLAAIILAYTFGVLGGIFLAYRRGTWAESVGLVGVLMTRAAPQFWVGMIVIVIFSFNLGWFPSGGSSGPGVVYENELDKLLSPDFWRHLALPMLTLAVYLNGLPLLLMRSNMLDVMGEDFVTMARLQGLPERRIMVRHAARNALLPVVTALALGVGYAIGGNVLIENVFSWPGLGRVLVRSVAASDYPLAQGAFFLLASVMVVMNFVADIFYGLLDPRVASGRAA